MACAKELPFKDFTCLNVKGGEVFVLVISDHIKMVTLRCNTQHKEYVSSTSPWNCVPNTQRNAQKMKAKVVYIKNHCVMIFVLQVFYLHIISSHIYCNKLLNIQYCFKNYIYRKVSSVLGVASVIYATFLMKTCS